MFIILNFPFCTFPTPKAEVINGTSTDVAEKTLQCDFSFSVSRDHFVNETTIVGHVGKNATMTFINPGKFVDISAQFMDHGDLRFSRELFQRTTTVIRVTFLKFSFVDP